MPTIFTKIINGEIPCYKIAEDADFLAFLDINPNTKGHTLCIPKIEVDKILDMEENHFTALMTFSRKVGKAIGETIDCKRVGITVIGLEVQHAHVHLIPLNSMEDARFQHKEKCTPEEFEAIAASIRANIQ